MNEILEAVNKTPIEIALRIDDEGFTTAKKLYEFLELNPKNYSHWCKANITDNEFAEENIDYWAFVVKDERKFNPNPTTDFKLTASFAKKLSVMQKSERGEQARNYFIGCEQALAKLAEQKHRTEVERAKGIAVRQALTKAIQQSGENDRMHNMAYPTYTDLIYRSLFGKSARQFREENGLTKQDNLRDLFSEEELKKIQNAEMLVSSLIGYGWGYAEIKDFVVEQTKKLIE